MTSVTVPGFAESFIGENASLPEGLAVSVSVSPCPLCAVAVGALSAGGLAPNRGGCGVYVTCDAPLGVRPGERPASRRGIGAPDELRMKRRSRP